MFPKILEGTIFEKNWVKFSWKIKCFLYKMPTFPSKNWRFFQLFHWEHLKSQVLWFLKNPTLKNLVPQSVWKSLLVGLIPPFGSTVDSLLGSDFRPIRDLFWLKLLFVMIEVAWYEQNKNSVPKHKQTTSAGKKSLKKANKN